MASTPNPRPEQLREQAFWIYSVIVGLSLGQAMKDVLPRVLPPGFLGFPQPAPVCQPVVLDGYMTFLESLRLFVFLMMITRFFLGSVVFFKSAPAEGGGPEQPGTSKLHEFFLGYLHFLFFFVWSLTLTSPPRKRLDLSGYLVMLGIILLLDLLYWFSPSWKAEDGRIRVWALRNLMTAGWSFVVLILAHFLGHLYPACSSLAEPFVLIIVSLVTFRDFREMFKSRTPKLGWHGIFP